MDWNSPNTQMSAAALVASVLALGFSACAAFPELKSLLIVVRDAVLWLALFVVLGGAGFLAWQRLEHAPAAATAENSRLSPSPQPFSNRSP